MAKREYKLQKRCAHDGCTEVGRWTYDTARDLAASYERRNVYRCVRHTNPGSVLSADNPKTEIILTCKASDRAPGLYWDGLSGLHIGPGFKAWADDFPEGTRLIVTARIERFNAESNGALAHPTRTPGYRAGTKPGNT
jgi:hypothetical protein